MIITWHREERPEGQCMGMLIVTVSHPWSKSSGPSVSLSQYLESSKHISELQPYCCNNNKNELKDLLKSKTRDISEPGFKHRGGRLIPNHQVCGIWAKDSQACQGRGGGVEAHLFSLNEQISPFPNFLLGSKSPPQWPNSSLCLGVKRSNFSPQDCIWQSIGLWLRCHLMREGWVVVATPLLRPVCPCVITNISNKLPLPKWIHV